MRSLLISLGGARYPNAPHFAHAAFEPSSLAVAGLMMHAERGIVEQSDHLNLFDDDRSWPDQLIEARNWIRVRVLGPHDDSAREPQNILIHYVGHGWFLPNSQDHLLTINHTDVSEKAATSAVLGQINSMLLREASGLRRFYLIDACFAAASLRDVMTDDEIIEKELGVIIGAWPEEESGKRGVAALCSADKDSLANAGGERECTQFTDGLLAVLERGDFDSGERISLRRLFELLRVALRAKYPDTMVHPVLVAPNDRDGGIAGVPLFINSVLLQKSDSFSKVAAAVTNIVDAVRDVVTGNDDAHQDAPKARRPVRRTRQTEISPDPGTNTNVSQNATNSVIVGIPSELARALEIALSEDLSFRQLVYRFFRLSPTNKNSIINKLKVKRTGDARMSDIDRFKIALACARDNGQIKKLEILISEAERTR